jgi:hypothetical protein
MRQSRMRQSRMRQSRMRQLHKYSYLWRARHSRAGDSCINTTVCGARATVAQVTLLRACHCGVHATPGTRASVAWGTGTGGTINRPVFPRLRLTPIFTQIPPVQDPRFTHHFPHPFFTHHSPQTPPVFQKTLTRGIFRVVFYRGFTHLAPWSMVNAEYA